MQTRSTPRHSTRPRRPSSKPSSRHSSRPSRRPAVRSVHRRSLHTACPTYEIPNITANTTQSLPPVVTSNVFADFESAVGNTPLIKLQAASAQTGCNIFGKAEYANPGGSVKDRAALYMIKDAEERGILTRGKPGLIIEATAGNTGLGLSLCANSRGYRTIIVIPETQTEEKKATLRATGALLIESAALPYKNPGNYVHVARRLAEALTKELSPNVDVFYPNQWDNVANAKAHVVSTSREIYQQLGSIGLKPDGFNAAIGTGGTLVGTATGLRQLHPDVTIGLTDPLGALPYTYYTTGQLAMGSGGSITEGIGQGRLTGNLRYGNFKPDVMHEISDSEALHVLNDLTFREGLQVGLSSGINVAGAIRLAKHLGPGHTIVTMLCDNAMRYASKMYNVGFLQGKNLPIPYWMPSWPTRHETKANDESTFVQVDPNVPLISDYLDVKIFNDLVQYAKHSDDM